MMNKRLLVLLMSLACLMPAFAQDPEPTSVDSAKEVPVAPVPVTKNVELDISRFGIDQIIDNGFGVFGNPITNTVFYAPAFGEDVLMKEVGKDRSDQSFFDNPPFTLSYEKGESPSFGTVFEVYEDASGQMFVKYPSEEDVTFGSTINVDGFDVQVNKVGYNTEKDQLILSLVSAGGNEILEKLQLSNTAIQEGTSGDEIKSINVAYEKVVPVDANGKVKAGGFDFELKKSESSNYSFAEGKTYSFQVSQITFLPIVIIILLLGATFFTFYFGFVNIRKFGLAVNVVRGKYSDPNEAGEVSHFQALTAALSGTVGLGNIAGVAIAISIGGAGATFWMIIAGLLGMSSKFAECTLGVKYRQIDADGEVSGGPMYYLSQGLKEKGLGGLGRIFAIFFAVMCIGGSFGGGNMFQVNQAYKQFVNVSHLDVSGWIFGIVMAALVAVVIIGGIKSIASVTDKIVPFMVGIYVAAALIIIGLNLGEVPRAFSEIFAGAFAPTAVAGGFIGVLIQGFRRAAFSNEAGVGSASIAHSAVKTNNPASEGIVALLEPFIDTVVVCTMTALVIVITDNHLDPNASDGVVLTSRAFASQIPFADYILAIAVILFAFSTMITWSYYGLKAWTYLFGDSNVADITYKVLFCTFVVIGSAATLGSVTGFSDAMIFAMSVPNIIGVVILSPVVKEELQKYIGKIKSGEIVRVK